MCPCKFKSNHKDWQSHIHSEAVCQEKGQGFGARLCVEHLSSKVGDEHKGHSSPETSSKCCGQTYITILLYSHPAWQGSVFVLHKKFFWVESHACVSLRYHIGLESVGLSRSATSYPTLYVCRREIKLAWMEGVGNIGREERREREGLREREGEGRPVLVIEPRTTCLLGRRPLEMRCSLGPCHPNPPASAFWLQDRWCVLGLCAIFTDLSSFTKQWIIAQGKILSFSVSHCEVWWMVGFTVPQWWNYQH